MTLRDGDEEDDAGIVKYRAGGNGGGHRGGESSNESLQCQELVKKRYIP